MEVPPEILAQRPADLPARLIERGRVAEPELHRRGGQVGARLHHGRRVDPSALVEIGALVVTELLRHRAGVLEAGLHDLRVGVVGPFLRDVGGIVDPALIHIGRRAQAVFLGGVRDVLPACLDDLGAGIAGPGLCLTSAELFTPS